MRDFSPDHRWLSINTATVRRQRGAEWPLIEILDACAARGIRAVAPWRDQVAAAGLAATARAIRAHGLELSGYCRGGMFTYADAAGRQAARDDNRRALDEACTLGAPCVILVVGGLPGALAGKAAHKDISAARAQVTEGIAALLDDARERRMPLAIEPLHPMYAADRACINTLEQALDVCDALDPQRRDPLGVRGGERAALGVEGSGRAALGIEGSGRTALGVEGGNRATPGVEGSDRAALGVEGSDRAALGVEGSDRAALGVAVDLYHVWWDPKLAQQIERAGRERLLAFHVCDWLTPTTDLLEDRGMMGDGVIEIAKIRGLVEAQGFAGYSEVEIFSAANWWQRDGGEVLDTCIARHRRCV